MLGLEIIRYSLVNLWSRKTRSFLTILSIFIGISAIFIFASFGLGLYQYVNDIANSAGIDIFMVQAKGIGIPGLDDTFKLEEKDLKAVQRTNGVKSATAWYVKSAEVEKNNKRKYVFLAGMLPEKEDIRLVSQLMTVGIEKGRNLKKGDSKKVTLGYNYMVPDKIFPKPYELGQKIQINGEKYEIVGFWESIGNPGDDSNIYMLEDDMKLLLGDDITYGALIGSVFDVKDIDSVVNSVEKNLRKVRDLEEGKEDFFVQSFSDAIDQFMGAIGIVVGFIFLIVVISAIVASVNTANTMVTSVLERVREIGVIKSIGAKNSTVRDLFLFESGILGLVAGVIGVLIGYFLSYIGGQALIGLGWGFLSPVFPWWLFVICIVLSVGVGTISGVVPAVYASKQKPVDALRYE